jgi:mannose-1-phosphate guanylyltransferase
MKDELEEFKRKSVVISPVGGKGSRFIPPQLTSLIEQKFGKKTLEELYLPKHLLKIGEKTLLEFFITPYKKFGINVFVFLLGKGAEPIQDFLGDGSKFGIEIRYSYDPLVSKVGKGKAIKYAYDQKVIDVEEEPYVHVGFPDDLILYPFFVEEYSARFLYYKKRWDCYGVVVLSYYRSPFGEVEVERGNGRIKDFVEKPLSEKLANTGRYVYDSRKVLPYIQKIDLNSSQAIEFEEAVLTPLAKEGKLGYYILPTENDWIPINSLKDYERALYLLR